MKTADYDLDCPDGIYGGPIECNKLLLSQRYDHWRIDQLN